MMSLQRTRLHCSRVQWWHPALSVASCFHFVIIPLTVDSSKEMSQMDLLHRWQSITVPCLNSLSS
ncbi:unnamed protein product [Staurois parvus]|uniref:Uncharacterized protein n=1 Tax=Staurois parvus TaxID=386267 RepID=A0ABN9GYV3_9NEOB|nr:unnamed protein product [Staurois parvus]